jgi:hypothetical protein
LINLQALLEFRDRRVDGRIFETAGKLVSSSQELQDGPDVSSEFRKLGGATSES